MTFQSYLLRQTRKINEAIEGCLPGVKERPSTLHRAMRYAALGGGKRIRPVFVLTACEAVGGDEKDVMPAACALELIHSYSLVHDDLPCMDDGDTRRGRPSCHKKFGEETALLAGDALQTLAFKILSVPRAHESRESLLRRLAACRWIAEAAGTYGMAGGQAVDIETRTREIDLPTAEYINTHKSGALIAVCVKTGAYLGGGSAREVETLYRYGKYAGLLFQIVDDILDREGYAKVIGVPEARKEAEDLLLKAKSELRPFGKRGRRLGEIADFILRRTA